MAFVFHAPIEIKVATIKRFDPNSEQAKDDLRTLLHDIVPAEQNFVEVASDGVIFQDGWLDPSLKIAVQPAYPEQFSVDDIIDILALSSTWYFEPDWLRYNIKRRLDRGVVIANVEDSLVVIGSTFHGIQLDGPQFHNRKPLPTPDADTSTTDVSSTDLGDDDPIDEIEHS